jgi:hypothetical protein
MAKPPGSSTTPAGLTRAPRTSPSTLPPLRADVDPGDEVLRAVERGRGVVARGRAEDGRVERDLRGDQEVSAAAARRERDQRGRRRGDRAVRVRRGAARRQR